MLQKVCVVFLINLQNSLKLSLSPSLSDTLSLCIFICFQNNFFFNLSINQNIATKNKIKLCFEDDNCFFFRKIIFIYTMLNDKTIKIILNLIHTYKSIFVIRSMHKNDRWDQKKESHIFDMYFALINNKYKLNCQFT